MENEALKRLRKWKTMVISGGNEPWSAKVYYALSNGFVFLIEKGGKTHTNILKDNKVSFAIDKDKPDFFFQGTGRVEILGEPHDYHIERGTLIYKIPQDALFVKSGHVLIARLIPEIIRVTDMRYEPKKYNLEIEQSDLNQQKKFPYFRALRPWSFQQSVTSLIFGAILASKINFYYLLLSLIALILIHGAINALSDYFDFVSVVDRPNTMGSAGARVLIDRILSPRKELTYIILLFIIGSIIGLYLVILMPILWPFIVLGIVTGLLYGLPKIGWKWLALGDLAVFLAFGPGIFLGSYILQGGTIKISEILISISLGLIIVAILHANNWRDMSDDLSSGVRTVASILREKGSMIYYLFLIWFSFPLFLLAVYFNHNFFPILGAFLTIPWAVQLSRVALNSKNWNRNVLDVKTANFTALHMYFSVGFMIIYLVAERLL
ncbi:MAG: UbiA family prenyltransferase [Thermoplasmata archaeon]